MKTGFKTILATLLFGGSALLAAQESVVSRYALIVGANNGGSDRVRLLYAGKDAQSFGTLMREIGGISPAKTRTLFDPSPRAILREIESLNRLMGRESGVRRELIFYYSGHSNTRGFLLNNAILPYESLRDAFGELNAEVTVAILDSCYSGEFIRPKGGSRVPPFMTDQSTDVEGHVYLTSSSASEEAQ